jgi:hypothetical protein
VKKLRKKPISGSFLVENTLKRFKFLVPNSSKRVVIVAGNKLGCPHLPISRFGRNGGLLKKSDQTLNLNN